MGKKLVIVGAGEMAEIAYEYFTHDSEYDVVAFAVEAQYLNEKSMLFDLPIIEIGEMNIKYPPNEYETFVAISSTEVNRVRTRLYNQCKRLGYRCASYVSSKAFVWHNVEIGENSFIFEDNTLQYHVKIGNNVILWSGNHVGHRTVVEDNCFLTSHVVVSGYCHIGKNSFIGVNATIGDYVDIAEDVLLSAGSVTVKALDKKGYIYMGSPAKPQKTIYEKYGIKEDA